MVYVFTGNGKGKTSAAIGCALRSLAHNLTVTWISWYKNTDWPIGEVQLPVMLLPKYRKNLEMYWMGKGFYLRNSKTKKVNQSRVHDFDTQEGHKKAAESGLNLAKDILNKKIPRGGTSLNLLILDEILVAVADGLLQQKDIVELIKLRNKTNIILTGRGEIGWLTDSVDLISIIDNSKHPYDRGIMALPGLDF